MPSVITFTGMAEVLGWPARLPLVDFRKPDSLIGTNTVASMQSGLYYGAIGAIDGAAVAHQHLGDGRLVDQGLDLRIEAHKAGLSMRDITQALAGAPAFWASITPTST